MRSWTQFVVLLGTLGVLPALAGCADRWARGLGATPVSMVRGADAKADPRGVLVPLARDGSGPRLTIYLVDDGNRIVSGPSTKDDVYRVADVSEVVSDPYLGVKGSSADDDKNLLERRRVLAMTLMSIADDNGAEYWRRFSALMTYRKATRDTGKAFMGSSIAATFISPVLGASLAGAGLAFDTFTDRITSDFDIEMYGALREAVRAEVIRRRTYIRKQLARPYPEYPACSVIADVNDYAHIYSIRGAVDALKRATETANKVALDEQAKAGGANGGGSGRP